MRQGKLTQDELILALKNCKPINPQVIKGCGIGEDCAVININGNILVSADPITAECDNIGELVIDINANDIYASGGIPVCATLTVIAPTDEKPENVIKIIDNAFLKAKLEGIDIIGGHTEFSESVRRTIVSMTIIGMGKNIISNNKCEPTNSIIVTKYLALEGTQILLSQFKQLETLLTKCEIEEVMGQNLSVKAESIAVKNSKFLVAMHDITEGGLFGAVCEVACASGCGAEIYEDKLPCLLSTKKICDNLKIDVGELISSGSMLIVTNYETEVLNLLKNANVKATVVGKFTQGSEVFKIDCNGNKTLLTIKSDKLFSVKEVNI